MLPGLSTMSRHEERTVVSRRHVSWSFPLREELLQNRLDSADTVLDLPAAHVELERDGAVCESSEFHLGDCPEPRIAPTDPIEKRLEVICVDDRHFRRGRARRNGVEIGIGMKTAMSSKAITYRYPATFEPPLPSPLVEEVPCQHEMECRQEVSVALDLGDRLVDDRSTEPVPSPLDRVIGGQTPIGAATRVNQALRPSKESGSGTSARTGRGIPSPRR